MQWFEDKGTLVFCDFLQRWPTLKAVHQARRTTLEHFFHEHNVRQATAIKRRIESIKTSVALTDDEAVIEPSTLLVKALVEQLRVTIQAIQTFDDEIAARAPAHPDFHIMQSFPAAGPVFAPRLLTAFGEQRERYPNADALQRYAGVAPITARSGNFELSHLLETNLRRVGGPDHPTFVLVLSPTTQRR